MRLRATIACSAAVSAVVLVPLAGRAAAADTYTAFTVDSTTSLEKMGLGASFVLAPPDGTVTATGTNAGITVSASSLTHPGWQAVLAPRTGTVLEPGTWDVAKTATNTMAGLYVTRGTVTCTTVTGTLTISEITFDGDGAIATLAATYKQVCDGAGDRPLYGELRIASALPYKAAAGSANAITWPTMVVGRSPVVRTYTLTNQGTADIAVGTTSLTGTDAADYAVTADGCSNATLVVGASCAIDVSLTPSVPADRFARLVVHDDTRRATRTVYLTGYGSTGWAVYAADKDEDGDYGLYRNTMEKRGEVALVADGTVDHGTPAVSPDGTKVAYTSDAGGEYYHLWLRNIDGTGSPVQLTTGAVFDESPAWSPDGTTLVFERYDASTDVTALYRVPASGGAAVAVPGGAGAAEPSFSPSGRQLAVSKVAAPYGVDIITLATGARFHLAGTDNGGGPAWSPDGQRIAFAQDSTANPGRTRLATVAPGTGVVTQVVDDNSLYLSPAWVDAARICYDRLYVASFRIDCRNVDTGVLSFVAGNYDGDYADASAYGPPVAPDTTAPNGVGAVSGAIGASGTIKLTWDRPAGATEFVVRRASGTTAPASIGDGTLVYDGAATSATVTGLTNGTAYSFSVFALDASGNMAATAATLTARPLATPVMITPTVTATGSASYAFTVRWAMPAGGGSAAGYDVDYGVRQRSSTGAWSSPVWSRWRTNSVGTSATFSAQPGQTIYFRVRARDGHGGVTPFSSAKPSNVPFDDRAPAIVWSTGWTAVTGAYRYLGTLRYATTAGRTATLTAETQGFSIVGDRCSVCGQVRVYVDGVLRATVDTRGSTTQVRQVLYTTGLVGGIKKHTIKLVTVGTADRPRVVIDGVALYR